MKKFLLVCLGVIALSGCDRQGDQQTMADRPPAERRAPQPPQLPPPRGLVAEGAEWETVADGYVFSDGPAADDAGNVYFAEVIFKHLYKVDAGGNVEQFATDTQMTMGLVMGADGRIYGCRNHAAQIVRIAADGSYTVLLQGEMTALPSAPEAPGEFCNDLAINAEGGIWFTDRLNQRVRYLSPAGDVRTVAEGWRPNGIVLSADRSIVAVTNSLEPRLHAFRVGKNGALTEIANFFDSIRTVERLGEEEVAAGRPGSDGMTVDRDGRFYVASFYGIQVFGPDGKFVGVISKGKGFISNLTFGGPEYGWLYATGRNGLYRLKMQVSGPGWGAVGTEG